MSKSVPAWICEMYDATAYMELVWSNAQSELTALERGLHSGMDVKAYATSACRACKGSARGYGSEGVRGCV
jgi:hypothetical protein